MLKKIQKLTLAFIGALIIFSIAGCEYIAPYNQDWVADYVATAIAEEDEDALWECLSPATQEELLRSTDNDLRETKKGILALMRLFALSQGINPDDLGRDEGLTKRLANKLKSNDLLIKIDGRWYLYLGGRN